MHQLILLLLFMSSQVLAQPPSSPAGLSPPDSSSGGANFQPSLAVVIGILAIMFSLTFILLVYAKFCHRPASVHNNHQNLDGLLRSGSRFSGIDKTVIESLPFFRFSSLRGSREGLECAVCLSKFEDIEVLRLLPKCKHAFHIGCVDQWLEKHSSCPLCRHKVSAEDLALSTYSNSLRFLWNSSQSGLREDSNVELFVQREEDRAHGSSRFSVGSSFRKGDKGKMEVEEEVPIQDSCYDDERDDQKHEFLHKFNHKIIVSEGVLKNRWSNVSSSDLMFLNSEMLGATSSDRFSSVEVNDQRYVMTTGVIEEGQIMKIKNEMEKKRVFENRVGKINQSIDSFPNTSDSKANPSSASRVLYPNDKRSMSEIIHPRFAEFGMKNSVRESSLPENAAKEERLKRLWLPIARKTVQWFANRENKVSTTVTEHKTTTECIV